MTEPQLSPTAMTGRTPQGQLRAWLHMRGPDLAARPRPELAAATSASHLACGRPVRGVLQIPEERLASQGES